MALLFSFFGHSASHSSTSRILATETFRLASYITLLDTCGILNCGLMISMLLLCRLGRLQDSNAVLTHFNEYSEQCFAEVSTDLASKARLLKSMKDDLDHIFMKLRSMKSRLASTYPDAFPDGAVAETMDQRPDLETPLE